MKLSNGKLIYDGHELVLDSCDIYFSHAPSRDTWVREGFYSNEVLDNIEVFYIWGKNPGTNWDTLAPAKLKEGKIQEQDLITLTLDDGAIQYNGKFYISQKTNKKIGADIRTFVVIKCYTLGTMTKSTRGGSGSGITEERAIELDNVAKAAAISTSEGYTDTKVADCVKSASSVTTGQKVYVRESGTDKTINYGSGVDLGSGTLVLRATNAQIKVPDTPTADADAASKKYVDGQVTAGGTSTLADAKAYTDGYAVKKTGDKIFKVGVDASGLYFEEE